MEKIINILKSSGADAWELTDIKTRGWEFYFIGSRLDQNRAKDVEHITAKVYKYSENGSTLGFASAEIPPTAGDEEVRQTVSDLVYQASLIKNKAYKLNPGRPFEKTEADIIPLRDDAEAYIRALQSVEETETEYINSCEVFVQRNTRRFITSEGIDITEDYPSSTLDIVVNAKHSGKEIELYRLYSLGTCDPELLRGDTEALMRYGRDRIDAEPTPALGTSAIVLSTDAALEVYGYFRDNLDAAFVVRGMSSFEEGRPVAEYEGGDRITLRAVKEMPGSPSNFACDAEGAPVRDMVLIDEGVVRGFTGNRMFSQYMGLDDSFMITNWSVSGGSETESSIRDGEFLEIVEFSDFQVDSMTGDIFGEIRLAYYHDGSGTVRAVTGGSVSGSIQDNLGSMRMTAGTRRYANAEIPLATRLAKVTVAGA
ncbi:MAG: TldD/PmbA family protein [Mogibacterium sp.]|nr:TldD/PmbA family protein [Mogibacterium sp.]